MTLVSAVGVRVHLLSKTVFDGRCSLCGDEDSHGIDSDLFFFERESVVAYLEKGAELCRPELQDVILVHAT